MIRRHTKSAIAMHWFNALCWILLLFSGFGLLTNLNMQPVGQWWTGLWTAPAGEYGLLHLHRNLGLVWVIVYLVYCLVFLRSDVLPFLREIFRLSPVQDLVWCLRKGFWLVLGAKKMRSLGLNPELPPQGFYNAGQKWVAVAAVLCSLLLIASGFLLYFSNQMLDMQSVVQWALFIHMACAGLMAILLPVHIYMAAFAPGEAPALKSMLTGQVPEDFAKHHNPLWHAELKKKGLVE